MSEWLQDLKYGSRALRRSPLFAFITVITLALAHHQAMGVDGDALFASILDVSRDDGGDTACSTYEECVTAIAGLGLHARECPATEILYGPYVKQGVIDPSLTLEALAVDDIEGLSLWRDGQVVREVFYHG